MDRAQGGEHLLWSTATSVAPRCAAVLLQGIQTEAELAREHSVHGANVTRPKGPRSGEALLATGAGHSGVQSGGKRNSAQTATTQQKACIADGSL